MKNNELEILFDYAEAGFRIFPLYPITDDGKCGCDLEDCTMAGKHPAVPAWQKTPVWSDEQLENMAEYLIETGYGVLCEGWLLIDVDPRNGGDKSYTKLCEDLGQDLRDSTFWVATGGGGWHVYLRVERGAYVGQLNEYPGIDFKSTGYVVGCGSLHASGALYERGARFPADTIEAPAQLLAMLKRREHVRASIDGQIIDVTLNDLREILAAYPNKDAHYDDWIATGMGLHHSTGGSADGYDMWVAWSSTSDKHNEALMSRRWHSFGKSPNPITLGTLIRKAEENGYTVPVTFDIPVNTVEPEQLENSDALPFDVSHCDPSMPPGFVGEVAQWINRQCYYPRERLSAMSAIMAIGNLSGLHWRCDVSGVATNMLAICVAGSGTGKEAVQDAFFSIVREGGLAACIHGDIKSKQEIIKNIIEHQACFYLTDEIGEILKTIENAKKRGGAVYLEGVTGELMKIFTKANGVLPVTGDVRRMLIKDLLQECAAATKIAEDSKGKPDGGDERAARAQAKADQLADFAQLVQSGGGIPKPFLSLIGFTTIESMEPALSVEMAKNGFLNRAFIIEERNNNPKPNRKFSPGEFPFALDLARIAATGTTPSLGGRIEFHGEPRKITTEAPAKAMLKQVQDWQWRFAEYHCETTGYEALARRAYEMICKVSSVLAIGDQGIRTPTHVEWATSMVKRDIDEKIRLIRYVESNGKGNGLVQRIISIAQEPVYESSLLNRLARGSVTKIEVSQTLEKMVEAGLLSRQGKKLLFVG